MAEAKRDNNYVTTLMAVSNVDGVTPVVLWADPTTHRLLVSMSSALDDLSDVVITSAAQGDILYYNGTNWVNLPAGTSGYFLKTQGSGANPTWAVVSAAVAGSDTQVQFNDGGAFGGDAGFVYNKTTNVATIGGMIISGLTASELVATDGSKNLVSLAVATYPSLAELAHVKGVTSAIQTQIGTKAPTASPSFTGTQTTTESTDASAVQVAIFEGDRATMADGDTAYLTLRLSNDGGTQKEFARMTWIANDVNAGTGEDGTLVFSAMSAGVLSDVLMINGTSLIPAQANIPLGTSVDQWADLFLETGGVIDLGAGDVTLTHSANLLTLAGGDFAMGANNLIITGSIAATGARVTKGWFTDIESTNMPTVGGTAILSSLTAPQFTTIELGHATDTTLSRSAAGVIAVEGVVIPSISSTNTLTNKRVTKRTGTTTSSATPTINTDNVDFYSLTAQAEDITSFTTNLSGTPTENQTLWIAITGTAARAITWGASFEASTVALPTTTVTTARLDVGFVWNVATSKWRIVATC